MASAGWLGDLLAMCWLVDQSGLPADILSTQLVGLSHSMAAALQKPVFLETGSGSLLSPEPRDWHGSTFVACQSSRRGEVDSQKFCIPS